jgi:hypothetical protein
MLVAPCPCHSNTMLPGLNLHLNTSRCCVLRIWFSSGWVRSAGLNSYADVGLATCYLACRMLTLQDKYGSFYADFREGRTFSSYFYVVVHLFENISCALIEASMQADTYGMYIATGVLFLFYMIIIAVVRPHSEAETFRFVECVNILIIYSLLVGYVTEKLAESEEDLSETATLSETTTKVIMRALITQCRR